MTISFSGLASGLDTSSWVESLVALKKAKVTTLQNEKSDVEITKAAVNDIKNFFVTFQSSLEKLTDAKFSVDSVDLFVQNIANTSDADVFTALASTEAIEGSYKIAVEKLATYTTAYSDYSYTTTYTETTTATSDSTLTSLGVNIDGAAAIGVRVNGVERGLTLSEFETLGSFVTKLNDIGVDASYNEESGIFSVNLDMDDINDIDGTGLVTALNLVKVNEGYQSGVWQTVEQQDNIETASLSTKLSELGRGQSISGQVIVRNSSGEESSFSVNNNMTIAGFIGELQNRGLYANLTEDGLLEISGGNIIGGSFDAIDFFGLDENPVSAMVTGDELTTTIIVPNKVELTTRLVEDLGVSKGYLEITNPDGDKYYEKIYSGKTISDFITDLGNLGISATLDAANGILTITGGSFDTLTDSEVVSLCNNNKITEPDATDRKGTNLLSLLGLNVEANVTVSSTRAMSRAMTYSKTAAAEDSDVISNFVTLPNNKQITVHAQTGEVLGQVNVTNDTTFEDLFSALSQFGIDGDMHDGVIMFSSDDFKYLTGDVITAMGVVVSYETTSVTTTVGTQQSTQIKNYTQTDIATNDNKLSDFISDVAGKKLNVKDKDGNVLYTFTATNNSTFADLFNAIAPYGMDGDLNEGIASFTHDYNGYVDGDLASALGVSTTYNTVTTYKTVGSQTTGTLKQYSQTDLATNDNKLSDFISDVAGKKLNVKDKDGNVLYTFTATSNSTFADLFNAIAPYGMDGDLNEGIASFTHDYNGYVDGDLAAALGVSTTYNTVTTYKTVGSQTTGTLKQYSQTDLATNDNKLSDFISNVAGKKLNVKDKDGNVLYTFTATNNSTFADLFNAIAPYGMDGDLNEGIASFTHDYNGYVDGDLASALGVSTTYNTVTTYKTVGSQTTGTLKQYSQTDLATNDNKLSDFISNVAGKKLNVKDKDGNVLYTFTANDNSTFADLFNAIAPYGMDGDLNEGIASFTHDYNGYVDGDLASALGVSTTYNTVTTTRTVGSQTTGTLKQYSQTDLATNDNKLSDFISDVAGKKLNVKDKDGNVLYTFTANDNSTFADLFNAIAPYGMDGDLNEGIASFTHDYNGYVDGNLASALGVSTTYNTVTTYKTVGSQTTGTLKQYSVTDLATNDNKLKDFISDVNGKQLNVKDKDGNVLYTFTANDNSTFADLFNAIAPYGMDGDLNEGIASFTHDYNGYVDGSLATALGVSTTYNTVTTYKTVGSQTTGTLKQYSVTDLATNDNKLKDFISDVNGKQLNVKDKDGNVLYTFTANDNSTFADLFNAIAPYGMDGDLNEGIASFTHDYNGYVDGSLATALGVTTTYNTVTTTTTIGSIQATSTFKYTTTYAADDNTTFAQMGINANKNYVINRSSTGETNVTLTATTGTKVGEFFSTLSGYGIQGTINDGVIMLQSDSEHYITGDLATVLGIGTYNYTQTVQGSTTGILNTSGLVTISASDTITVNVTKTQTVASTGSVTVSAVGTITVDVTTTQTVTSTGSVTISATDTIVVDVTRTVDTSSTGYVTVSATDTIVVDVTTTQTVASSGSVTVSVSDTITVTMAQTLTVNNTGTRTLTSYDTITLNVSQTHTVSSTTTTVVTANSTITCLTTGTDWKPITRDDKIIDTQLFNVDNGIGQDLYNPYYDWAVGDNLGWDSWDGPSAIDTRFIVYNQTGNELATITVLADTSWGALFDELDDYGIIGTITDGVVSFSSSVGNYISDYDFKYYDGDRGILRYLGIGYMVRDISINVQTFEYSSLAVWGTCTIGNTQTSTAAVNVRTTAELGTKVLNTYEDGLVRNATISSSTTDFSAGSVFVINTEAGLKKFRDLVNAGYSTVGKTFILNADISLTGNWVSIGTASNVFRGTFNGNGYTISNLTQTVTAGATFTDGHEIYAGLFGKVSGVTIKNVNLDGVNIKIDSGVDTARCGALVADISNSADNSTENAIKNVYVSGNISLNNRWNGSDTIGGCTGGLIGMSGAPLNVNNCSADVYIGQTGNNRKLTNTFIGGIVGNLYAYKELNISGCSFYGEIDAKSDMSGGIVGYYNSYYLPNNVATISDCFASGYISGGLNVQGGIIGGIYNGSQNYYDAVLNIKNCVVHSSVCSASAPNSGIFIGALLRHDNAQKRLNVNLINCFDMYGHADDYVAIGYRQNDPKLSVSSINVYINSGYNDYSEDCERIMYDYFDKSVWQFEQGYWYGMYRGCSDAKVLAVVSTYESQGAVLTIKGSTTISNVMNFLTSCGVTATFDNGQILIQDTGGQIITGGAADNLGIKSIDAHNAISTKVLHHSGVMELSTTLRDLGITNANIFDVYNGRTGVTTYISTDVDGTIGDLIGQLAAFDIYGSVNGGKLTIEAKGDWYISYIRANQVEKLKLSQTIENYKTVKSSQITTDTPFGYFVNTTAPLVTTIKEYRTYGDRIDEITYYTTITANNKTTVGDYINRLAAHGIEAYVEGGKFIIKPNSGCGGYIAGMDSILQNALKLDGDFYYGTLFEVYYNTNSNYLDTWGWVEKMQTVTTSSSQTLTITATDTVTVNINKTETIEATTTVTLNNTGTTTVNITKTYTVSDTQTVAVDTTGTTTVNIKQTMTVTATQTAYVSTTGSNEINIKQTITVTATQTTTVDTTGYTTVTIQQTITITASQTTNVDTTGYTTVTIQQTITIDATQTTTVNGTGTVTIDVTSTRTVTANDTADRKTYTTTSIMNDQTKFSDLGAAYNANSTITVNHEGDPYSIVLSSSNTIGDMLTALAGYGISGIVQNGSIILQGTADGYITGVNGAAYTLGLRANYTTSTDTVVGGSNSAGAQKSRTLTYNMDGNTKIKDINGLTVDGQRVNTGTIKVQYMGDNYFVTINGETTIDGLIAMLAGYGVEAACANGVMTFIGTQNGYIMEANGVASLLGAATATVVSSTTVTEGTNSAGDLKSRTLTYNMDGNTKIKDINGLSTTNGTIKVQYMGDNYFVTINGETTIDGLIGMLGGYGVEAACANGVMTFIGTQNGYIMEANGVATLLGAATATVISSTTVTEGTNSAGDLKSRTLTYNMDGNTKIKDINGLSTTNGTIKVQYMGDNYFVTINGETTIDSLIGMLAGYGVEAACANGVMTFIGTQNGYIMEANGVASLLGAATATVVSSTTVTEGTNSAGDLKSRTLTYNMDGNTKIKDINGLSTTNGTIKVQYMGDNYFVTINGETTIDSLIGMLAGYGVEAACANGVMTFIGTQNGYIMEANGVASLLGAATATVVSSTTVTEGTNSAGDLKSRTLTYNMDGNTKIKDINGLSTTNGTIKVQYMGDNYFVTINGETTIDSLIGMLAGYGVEAACANGVMTFIGTQNGYIMEANGVATLLGAATATVVSSTTVTEGTNSAGDLKSRTLTYNMDGNTKIKDINGLTNRTGTINVQYMGQNYSVTINGETTIDGLIGMLGGYGVEAACANGVMTFIGTENGYIMSANGVATELGARTATVISSTTVTEGTNSVGTYKARTLTFNMDGTTTFSQLGLLAGTATVQYGGSTHVISMNANNTMDDFLTALAGVGITGYISNGVMTLNGTYDGMIIGTTGGINSLGINAAYSTSTTYKTTGTDSTSTYMVRTTNPTMLRSTKLADLQDTSGNNLGITTGSYYVYSNGVRNVETITEDTTVEDLMSTMSRYGLISEYDTDGAISVSGYNNTYLETSSLNGANSNVVERLFNQWDFTKIYDSNHLEIPTAVIEAITRDTKLADIAEGNYQSGAVTIVKNGIQTNLMLNADDTVGTFLDELSMFGFESVVNDKGQIIIRNTGDGVLKAYTGADQASNILDIIGANTGDWVLSKSYESNVQNVITTQDIYHNANEATKLSEIATDFTGTLEVFVDGQKNLVQVSANETVGSLLSKFRAMGLEASITGGQVTIQSGFKDLSITSYNDNGNATSKLAQSGHALGLTFKDDLGNFIASSNTVQSTNTITEDVTLSVSNDAGLNTKFSLLNITDGTISIYRDGQRAVFRIGENAATGENIDTLGKLLTKIQQRFSDIDFKHNEDGSLLNGYLTVYSKTGAQVEVGATTDTSNFSSITGIARNEKGLAESARELYCVNNESVVTTEGLFRRGNVTEGVFTVGDAIITINSSTTLQNIVSQINSNSDKSHAKAYWDNVKGELVIEALDTGASFVNIEAGTSDAAYLAANLGVKASNFTDIMGYTTSTRTETGGILQNGDGSVYSTRMNTNVQKLGTNAKFTINGTSYTSTSNEIKSDVSRINGVTINLKGVSEGQSATLKVERDTETLTNAVQEVVDSYNDLMENVDKAIAKSGSLSTESTLKMIRNQIKNLMTSSVSGSTVFKNLDAIGISVAAATGTNVSTTNDAIVSMTLDKSKFIKAFNSDQTALKSLLVGTGDKAGTGILDKLEKIVENAVGSTGYFTTADKAYAKQITTLNEKITKATQAAERYRAQLESKFRAMDMLISKMNQQYSSFLN